MVARVELYALLRFMVWFLSPGSGSSGRAGLPGCLREYSVVFGRCPLSRQKLGAADDLYRRVAVVCDHFSRTERAVLAVPGRAVPGRAVPGRAVPGRAVPGRLDQS